MAKDIDHGIQSGNTAHEDSKVFVNRWAPVQIRALALDSRYLSNLAKKLDLLSDRTRGPEACHLWAGRVDPNGYGRLCSGKEHYAHRCAIEVQIGRRLRTEEVVRHTCDNPPCVNPRHLVVGTKVENILDCVAKDRHTRGERNGSSRLTADQVTTIRQGNTGATTSQKRALAAQYGVGLRHIENILRGQRWRHLPLVPA